MLLQNCLVFAVAAAGLAVDAATIHPRSNTPSATYPPPSWQARFRNLFRQQDGPTPPPQQPPPATTTPHHRLSQYQHDIVLRFNISTAEEARAVADAVNMLYLDVWSSTRTHIDIRLQQGTVPLLLDLLPETLQDSHSSLMHNLADLALETYPGTQESPVPHVPAAANLDTIEGQTNNNLFFADYQPLSVIVPWMDLLVSLFPSHVEILRIGKSFEGRKILGLKVGTPHPEGFKKRTVVVTGASHAREWISVSTVSYLAYSMITGFARDDKVIDRMVNEFDWIFIPTLNVDGYAYSWEHDRLWRKNRQPTSLAFCKGIDLDRAYDFHFDNSPQASTNPCSEMFPGGYPFQAQESKAFAHWASRYTKNGTQIIGLLDLHSYSQQILYPYSYSCNAKPPTLENLEELAMGLAKAIRLQSGEHYDVNSACDEYSGVGNLPGTSTSGSMIDYFYGKLHVPFVYQIKLRDTGSHGFLLPKENILPTGKEVFSLLKYFSQWVLDDGSPTLAEEEEVADEL